MPEWLARYVPQGWTATDLIWISVALFVVTFISSLIMVAIVAVKIPPDYFAKENHTPWFADRHPVLRWMFLIGKNLLGLFLVVLGVLLSLPGVPGQGILTILIGAMLMDFPGKRNAERWLLTRRGVLNALNRLRGRYGKEPLQL